MYSVLIDLLLYLLVISILGYIITVLFEKKNIKQNIILINNKYLKQEDINEVDINEFIYKGKRIKSGDEIRIITKENKEFNGTIIGARKSDSAIHIITYNNKIKKLSIDHILKFKIISRYGKFFNY